MSWNILEDVGDSISIAVVNYNTRELLRACLQSAARESTELLVFDNASTDGSVQMVNNEFPHALLYASKSNIGFGSAGNALIRASRAPFVLLLNSDSIVEPGALERLARYLNDQPRTGLAGPRLVNPDGSLQRSCYPFPGSLRWAADNDVICQFQPIRGLRNWSYRTWSYDSERVVPWVKGAAMAIRKSAFEQVGGFDTSYFMYYEEADLCYRLKEAGWEVRYAPVSTIKHVGGASTDRVRTEMQIQLWTSTLRFHQLHYSPFRCRILAVVWRLIILTRWLRDRVRLITARAKHKPRIEKDFAAWSYILRQHL